MISFAHIKSLQHCYHYSMKFSFQKWQHKHVSVSDMAKLSSGDIPAMKIFQGISGNQIMVQLSTNISQVTVRS